MITQRARTSGALFISSALWWWIAVSKGSETIQESENIPSSAWLIRLLNYQPHCSSTGCSRHPFHRYWKERGNATMSQIGGGLAVLAIFYIIEPVLMHFSDPGGDALFATGRVLVLAVMVGFASHMMFDALLLQWVRASMLNMGLEVFLLWNQTLLRVRLMKHPYA